MWVFHRKLGEDDSKGVALSYDRLQAAVARTIPVAQTV